MYTAAVGETPVVPAYDYLKVTETIGELDAKISKIKHAINLANVTNEVQVGERFMSIDSVLVEMAQLNKRKEFLDYLRKQEPEMRKEAGFAARNSAPEYQYINYDLELVKKEYETVAACIMEMQLALQPEAMVYCCALFVIRLFCYRIWFKVRSTRLCSELRFLAAYGKLALRGGTRKFGSMRSFKKNLKRHCRNLCNGAFFFYGVFI